MPHVDLDLLRLLQGLSGFACLWVSVCRCIALSPDHRRLVRLAYACMGSAAFAATWGAIDPRYWSPWPPVLVMVFASLLFIDGRARWVDGRAPRDLER